MAYAITETDPDRPSFAAGVGLAAFAISLPIMRIVADAPEFLIAHDLGRVGGLAFIVAITVAVPLVIGLGLAALGRWFRPGRTVAMAGLGIVACAGLLQPVSSWSVPFVLGSIVGGIALAFAEASRPPVRSVLASFTVLVVLLGVWAVGPSRVGSYVRSSDPTAAAAPRSVDTPVVFLVFDEMSMIPTLNEDQTINAERFPNLAALASTSHWFRHASSVSPQTSASVPALLSGKRPELDKVPVASDYPTNVFLQLGRGRDVTAHEPITALCPASMCDQHDAGGPPSLGTLLSDTALVLRQGVSSDAMRRSLPSISHGWAGFGGDVGTDIDGDAAPHGGYGTFPAQVDELRSLAKGSKGTKPDLIVGHFIAPHMPWLALPDGSTYEGADPAGMTAAGGTLQWTGTEADRRLGYQRYLLQVGALDRALGQARAELEAAGIWDDAVVVVTADHGVQFEPGAVRAVGPGGAEVTNVPLFIKEPHQRKGAVSSSSALTIDALPTILGLVGVEPNRPLDGVDLLAADVPERRRNAFLIGAGDAVTPDQSDKAIAAAIDRRAAWIDPAGSWDAAYQPGVDPLIVGTSVTAKTAAASGGTWQRAPGESGRQISFELHPTVAPTAAVAVCDGTVAGATPVSSATPRGSIFVSPDRCSAPDSAQLWLLDAQGRFHPLTTTT